MAAMCFEPVQRFILAKKYFGFRGTLTGGGGGLASSLCNHQRVA